MFHFRECHGRCVVRKLPLATLGLIGWRSIRLEAKKPGMELVIEIRLGAGEILGLGDLVMSPMELVVIGAGLAEDSVGNAVEGQGQIVSARALLCSHCPSLARPGESTGDIRIDC